MKRLKVSPCHIRQNSIYDDVIEKRGDYRPVQSEATLQKAALEDGKLIFTSSNACLAALHDGIFLLRIPPDFSPDACDLFANNFYKQAPIASSFRELKGDTFSDPLLGFHERINQIEQFLLERRFWGSHYPTDIQSAGEKLTRYSGQLLNSILTLTDIEPQQWSLATGGASETQGSYHLTFNHYRPYAPGIGLASHKDDGFLTILRTTEPGLEINRNDRWEALPPDPCYFVVNFGLSMEILTRNSSTPIRAIMHRVRHQNHDRCSFAHFTSSHCTPGSDAGIYRFCSSQGLQRICNSRDFINANDEEIYNGPGPKEYEE
ncbi:2OG-Fe(II) oxygenase family protein [Pseudomonas asiatica]|uniref:2OG-Fe(II) oxygenase family protein n=1 Tax=Pseudomonas asiatica TaxID=2219225 RepID=UPI00383B88E8